MTAESDSPPSSVPSARRTLRKSSEASSSVRSRSGSGSLPASPSGLLSRLESSGNGENMPDSGCFSSTISSPPARALIGLAGTLPAAPLLQRLCKACAWLLRCRRGRWPGSYSVCHAARGFTSRRMVSPISRSARMDSYSFWRFIPMQSATGPHASTTRGRVCSSVWKRPLMMLDLPAKSSSGPPAWRLLKGAS